MRSISHRLAADQVGVATSAGGIDDDAWMFRVIDYLHTSAEWANLLPQDSGHPVVDDFDVREHALAGGDPCGVVLAVHPSRGFKM